MQEISKEINYKNLIYNVTNKTSGSIYFIKFKGPFGLFKEIREGDILLEMAEMDQENFKRELGQVKSGNPKHKSEKQLYTIKNVQKSYNSREKIFDFFNDYSKIKSEFIYRSKHDKAKGTGLKILTPKQVLQRLPIALAQIKAGNNSERLLNKIRQIFYSLYQSKQITKKVCNNIIKAIQL